MNEQDQAVAEYLKAQGITYAVTGGFETIRNDNWKCDQWQVTFARPGKPVLVSDYFTGTGHRELTAMGKIEIKRAGKMSQGYRNSIIAKYSKPVAPTAASVLHSLLMDASSGEQNFHDFCDEYGYNKDSIKDQSIYNACCETLTKMRAFFTGTERTALNELLQDY